MSGIQGFLFILGSYNVAASEGVLVIPKGLRFLKSVFLTLNSNAFPGVCLRGL